MSFLRKMFGGGTPPQQSSVATEKSARTDSGDPDKIRAFDAYGREVFITRQQWKDAVLLGNLEKAKGDPEQLYGTLVGALQDGFAADVIPYAEHLWRTDPIPSRGATLLGVVYLAVQRIDEAQRVLEGFLATHGEDGVVLTNLAKVHSSRGDQARAESMLWHALEIDPNQDNGFGWYAVLHRERGGEAAELVAFRRVAALPRSWRAQLWLARNALQHKDLAAAEALYREALTRAGRPAPSDLLMQMSGDLGNSGYLAEIVRLVEPCFDVAVHGLQVGNNLIKAHCDLGRIDAARRVLNQLYAQKRPDWQRTLSFWDTELAKADLAERAHPAPKPLSATVVSIQGPVWARDKSPFAVLVPDKRADARRIAIFGSTMLSTRTSEEPQRQLSDAPGRLSRAVPLILAERIHLTTDAAGSALVPWVQNQGFALFNRPYEDPDLCGLAGMSERGFDFIVAVVLDGTQPQCKLEARLVRTSDTRRIAETCVPMSPDCPGPAVGRLVESLLGLLAAHTGVRAVRAPTWYETPSGDDLSDYLLRLEQQLAVACRDIDSLKGVGLFGEREILGGILYLCVHQPTNATVRLVLAETLRQMQKVRPEILGEYREKIGLLQRDHPLAGDVAKLINRTIADVLGG